MKVHAFFALLLWAAHCAAIHHKRQYGGVDHLSDGASSQSRKYNKNTDGHENRRLMEDDDHFWSRFLEQVASSSFTLSPSASPSQAPTGVCAATVSFKSRLEQHACRFIWSTLPNRTLCIFFANMDLSFINSMIQWMTSNRLPLCASVKTP